MADAAIFSWSALAVPVVSGAFTALTTALIVFGANWLTRKSIEESNKKSLEELKANFESSRELQLEIERMRVVAQENADWESATRLAYSDFVGFITQYQYITRDWIEIQNLQPEYGAEKEVILASQEVDRETTKKIVHCLTQLRVLFSRSIPEHEEFLQQLYKTQKKARDLRNNVAVSDDLIAEELNQCFDIAVQKGKVFNRWHSSPVDTNP